MEKLDRALRTLHLNPENVNSLVTTDSPYMFKDIARALLTHVWPNVSTGDAPVIKIPAVKGGLWIQILRPIGKIFGLGPDSRSVSLTHLHFI